MKIKHWQGYGCVNAKLIKKTSDSLKIHVWGMHEYGLETNDEYHIFNWLVRRFDKSRTNWLDIERVTTDDHYETDERNCSVEHCIYTITFRNRN